MKRQPLPALLSFVLVACSPAPDYLESALEFQQHKNDGDLESALELFVDEPSLHFGPLGTISGRTAVKQIFEYDLALNTHLTFRDCVANGLEVSCGVVETNDWLKTVDIDSIAYDENTFTFTADGHIESVRAALSAESAQLLGAAMAEFHAWATAHKPEEYGDLFSDEGDFVYGQENAEKVLALLRIWRNK